MTPHEALQILIRIVDESTELQGEALTQAHEALRIIALSISISTNQFGDH